MNREEFIASLNLPFEGNEQADEYVIILNNSDDFSRAYNLISNNQKLSMDDNSVTTTSNALFTFFNDDFEVRLTANFNKDIYRITVSDR